VSSVIIKHVDIVQEYVIREQGFFRARLTLQNDDFFLEVAEFFQEFQGEVQTVEYRYQWMDPERQVLRRRWDNAAHFPGCSQLPPSRTYRGDWGRRAWQTVGDHRSCGPD
jgi:hypothetical protein